MAESAEEFRPEPTVPEGEIDYQPMVVEHPNHPWRDHLLWEVRHAGGNLAELGLSTLEMLDRRRGPEVVRQADARERLAKRRIDGLLESQGFSKERVRCRRRSGAAYRTTVRYREGDDPKLRRTCLVVGHGLSAGYEASAAVLDSVDTDYPLTDFSLLLYNRPGVDASEAPKFINGYDPREHFEDQAFGQEQMLDLAVDRGAEHMLEMPHSMGAKAAQRNLRNIRRWKPETRAAYSGAILLNGPDDRESVYESSPIGWMRPMAKALTIAARQTHRPEGDWTRDALGRIPTPVRGIVEYFNPETVTRFLATHLLVDKMVGEVDTDVYHAAKWRAKHTNWRTIAYDLESMDHGIRDPVPDFALGSNFMVIEGAHDRLVRPGSGRGILQQLDQHRPGGDYNVVRHILPTGHYSHAEAPDVVNREAYLFAYAPEAYANWYHAIRKGRV